MTGLGNFALLLALFLSSYAVVIDLLGSFRQDTGLIKSARNATVAYTACLSVAMIALWILLVKSDFSVIYVAAHTSRALPFPYKISALWAGSAGSLLLWLWFQAVFLVMVYCKSEYKHRSFSANARMVANLVSVFFLIILNKDNPFKIQSFPTVLLLNKDREIIYSQVGYSETNERNGQNPLWRTTHAMIISQKGVKNLEKLAREDNEFLDYPIDLYLNNIELNNKIICLDFLHHIFYSPSDNIITCNLFKGDIARGYN